MYQFSLPVSISHFALALLLAAGAFEARAANIDIKQPSFGTNGKGEHCDDEDEGFEDDEYGEGGHSEGDGHNHDNRPREGFETGAEALAAGAGLTIRKGAFISTSCDNTSAVLGADGSGRHTISNEKGGRISTAGEDSHGIAVDDENTISNSGDITTQSYGAFGITIRNDNEISNSGRITTEGDYAHGISANNENKKISNSGEIITKGNSASGIKAGSKNRLISNSGKITTEGPDAYGIEANDENTLANSGEIVTRGKDAYGIFVIHKNKLANSDDITTAGEGAHGIRVINNNEIEHGGRITTSKSGARGIDVGDNNALILNGAITTGGARSPGVKAGADTSLTVKANSRIKTTGAGSDGIHISGLKADTTLDHRGRIEASATGIAVTGDLPTLTNHADPAVAGSGVIQGRAAGVMARNIGRLANSGMIRGQNGDGVRVTATLGRLENSGRITGGDDGIAAQKINALVNNKGGVITGGNDGIQAGSTGELINRGEISGGTGAALSAASLLNLTNSGTITSAYASAIRLTGTASRAATLTNTGTIRGAALGLDYGTNAIASLNNTGTIQGGAGPALRAGAIGALNNAGTLSSTSGPALQATGLARLTNSGTIEGQTAIRLIRTGRGSNTTIDNAGALRSLAGASGTALDFRGPGQDTLRLRAGSALEGQIRWDGAGDTLRLDAPGPARFTLIDNDAPANTRPTPFRVQTQGLPVLRSTTTSSKDGEARTVVTILDPTRTAPRAAAVQHQQTGAIFQSLASLPAPGRFANRRSQTEAPRQALWVRPFGGLYNFKRKGRAPAAQYRYGGALAGYSVSLKDKSLGGFLGAARSELNSQGRGADAAGRDIFLGAYLRARQAGLDLSVAVLFGKSRSETAWQRRNSMIKGGVERLVHDGQRYFISPELGLATRLDIRGVALIPELKLRYLGLFNAEERERGSRPNALLFKPEDRHIGLIRASLGFPLRFPANQYGGQLSGRLRLGAEGRGLLSGGTVTARAGNGVTRYKAGGDEAVTGFVGAGFEYAVPALDLRFSAEVEASYGSDAALGVRGQLGFVWGF